MRFCLCQHGGPACSDPLLLGFFFGLTFGNGLAVELIIVSNQLDAALVNGFQIRKLVLFDELADDDLALVVDGGLAGVGAMLENRVILVILKLVDAIAKAVSAQVKRWAG